jgi:hypothetical protein
MHILMHSLTNVQTLLTALFVMLLVAPLPIILLSAPLGYVWGKIKYKRYYFLVKKHLKRPELVNLDQLKRIFPGKQIAELQDIVYYLQPESSYKD